MKNEKKLQPILLGYECTSTLLASANIVHRILHYLPCFGLCGVLLQHTLFCYKQIKLTTLRMTSPVCQIENKSISFSHLPQSISIFKPYAKHSQISLNYFLLLYYNWFILVYVAVGCQTTSNTCLMLTQFIFYSCIAFDEKCGHKILNQWTFIKY